MAKGNKNSNWKGGKEVSCQICSNLFWVKPSHAEKRKTCSAECRNELWKKSGKYAGKNNPSFGKATRFSDKFEVCCAACGKSLLKTKSQLNRTPNPFCSRKCLLGTIGKRDKTGVNNPFWNGGKISISCETCSKEVLINPSQKGKARFCSRVCFSEFQKTLVGEKSYAWKGGHKSSEISKLRSRGEYKRWRKTVLKRDNYTCVCCGYNGNDKGKLHVDHIKSFLNFPDLRYDVNNGRVLCKYCHIKTDNYGAKVRRLVA